MTCEEFQELSGAYVLDALTSEEREAARSHLETCQNCTRLAQELRSVVDLLPLSVVQVSPSPALKERLLAALREEQKTPEQLLTPIPLAARRRQPRQVVRMLVAVAALLLLFLGGTTVWGISLQHQVTTLQERNTQFGSTIGLLEKQNTSLRNMIARVYPIEGNQAASTASGSLLFIPQKNITVLVLSGLPRLQGTQVYQGWLIHNNKPTSIGLLTIQNGLATLTFPGNVSGYETAAVSLEPRPRLDEPAPTGPVVATGQLQKPNTQIFL